MPYSEASLRRSTMALVVLSVGTLAGLPGSPGTAVAWYQQSPLISKAIDAYRSGDAVRTVEQVRTWSLDRVLQIASTGGTPPIAERAARALLLTEVGMARGELGRWRLSGGRIQTVFEQHRLNEAFEPISLASFELVDGVLREARRIGAPHWVVFARDWFVIAGSYCLVTHGRTWCEPFVNEAKARFGEDAAICLLEAAYLEVSSGPYWEGPEIRRTSHGGFHADYTARAESTLRRCVRLDTGALEPALRLGRLLELLDRRQEAEPILASVLSRAKAADNLFVGYLAALFLGHLEQDRGRWDEAAAYYEQAAALYPTAQTAQIALAHLRVRRGLVSDGLGTLASFLQQPVTDAHTETPDPWTLYWAAQLYQAPERLRVLRTQVAAER